MSKWVIGLAWVAWLAVTSGCGHKVAPAVNLTERGKYLVMIGGCNDCHTPKIQGESGAPVPDEKRLLSGHPEKDPYPQWKPADMQERSALALINSSLTAWAGPWGVSFAINLTPDKQTGIAEWSESAFLQAMRTGKHQGQPNGRDILPPMPWTNYRHMTDEDLKAMWAYLRSIPAVRNQVPLPVLPQPAIAAKKP